MAIVVKFTSGVEKEYAGNEASVSGPLFVLYIYNRRRRKLESSTTFPAEQVAWAKLADSRIVVGRGTVEPTHSSDAPGTA